MAIGAIKVLQPKIDRILSKYVFFVFISFDHVQDSFVLKAILQRRFLWYDNQFVFARWPKTETKKSKRSTGPIRSLRIQLRRSENKRRSFWVANWRPCQRFISSVSTKHSTKTYDESPVRPSSLRIRFELIRFFIQKLVSFIIFHLISSTVGKICKNKLERLQ